MGRIDRHPRDPVHGRQRAFWRPLMRVPRRDPRPLPGARSRVVAPGVTVHEGGGWLRAAFGYRLNGPERLELRAISFAWNPWCLCWQRWNTAQARADLAELLEVEPW